MINFRGISGLLFNDFNIFVKDNDGNAAKICFLFLNNKLISSCTICTIEIPAFN